MQKLILNAIPYIVKDIHPVIPILLANGGTVFGGIIRRVVEAAYDDQQKIVDYISMYLDESDDSHRGDVDVFMPFVKGDRRLLPEKTFDLLTSIFGIDNLTEVVNTYDFDGWKCRSRYGIRSHIVFHYIAYMDGIKFDISVTKHPERLLGMVTRYSVENMKLTNNGLSMCYDDIRMGDAIKDETIKAIKDKRLFLALSETGGVHNPGKFFKRTLRYLANGWNLHPREANLLANHANEIISYPDEVDIDLSDPKSYQLIKDCLYPTNDGRLMLWSDNPPKSIITIRALENLRSIAGYHKDTKWIDEIEKPEWRPWTLKPIEEKDSVK